MKEIEMTIMKLNASVFDELYTPPEVTKALIKHLPSSFKTVWCPCDTSDSNIVKELKGSGYKVIASHIKDGKDFLEWEPSENYDCIITNPPYSSKNVFIERCVELKKPWALLLPLDSLCGSKRFSLTASAGCITIAHRIDFTGKGANWFYNVWLCQWPEISDKWLKEP